MSNIAVLVYNQHMIIADRAAISISIMNIVMFIKMWCRLFQLLLVIGAITSLTDKSK